VGAALLVFLVVLGTTRYVSLSSMSAGVVFAFLQLLPAFRPANTLQIWFGFVLAAMLVYTHRANIGRLRAGTESRVPLWGKR
jgi:glycerol-3-phosphate acyltransferase PlsY